MVNWRRVSENMDMSKRYPGYFNKWIMRCMGLLMIGLFVFALYKSNYVWSGEYISCPATGRQCLNAYYEVPSCPMGDACNWEYLPSGYEWGVKPSPWVTYLGSLEFATIALCFGINHLYYKWRYYSAARS